MLEKMDEFFNNRIDGYEKHQLNSIKDAKIFYPFSASCLPIKKNATILDLGCGTGLELDYYFKLNPNAKVTGIDLASGMLEVFKNKFVDKDINIINASYFDVPLGNEEYDACISVESLHHFSKEKKYELYKKVYKALKNGGYFILTDYFAKDEKEETFFQEELIRLKKEEGINDDEFYHYDTPLTIEHEIEALNKAGFSVEVLSTWGVTATIKATKKII